MRIAFLREPGRRGYIDGLPPTPRVTAAVAAKPAATAAAPTVVNQIF